MVVASTVLKLSRSRRATTYAFTSPPTWTWTRPRAKAPTIWAPNRRSDRTHLTGLRTYRHCSALTHWRRILVATSGTRYAYWAPARARPSAPRSSR